MLTWAIVFAHIRIGKMVPLLYLIAMFCDVGIAYYVAEAIAK